jgi:endonuclease YncB( thermonuclease family)
MARSTTTTGPVETKTRTLALTARAHLSASLLALLAVLVRPASGQTVTDGDTLKQGGVTYRLWGIDAPELAQTCPDGWPAGRMASSRLQALTAGRSIVCQEKDRDRYGRTVAVCRASGEDLGAIMVREGLAWAFVRYSSDYVGQEGQAKAANLEVHAHGCPPAWQWRAEQRSQ